MIEIVREFVVKEGAQGQFELAYGPGGAWSDLLTQCPGFRGTTLMRDTQNPCRYLTIELWDTEAQWEQMLKERGAEYSEVETAWTESRMEVGVFRVLAEATVRPRGKAGRTGRSRRRSGQTSR